MAENVILWLFVAYIVLLLLYCPIFKPWFGFKKPPDHPGRWFQ